jgi:hypothetical protein
MASKQAHAIGIDITLGTFCAPIGRQGGKSRNRPESTICSGAGAVVVARAIVPRSLTNSYGSIERRALKLINGASAEQRRRPMLVAVKAMRPMKMSHNAIAALRYCQTGPCSCDADDKRKMTSRGTMIAAKGVLVKSGPVQSCLPGCTRVDGDNGHDAPLELYQTATTTRMSTTAVSTWRHLDKKANQGVALFVAPAFIGGSTLPSSSPQASSPLWLPCYFLPMVRRDGDSVVRGAVMLCREQRKERDLSTRHVNI